MATFIPALIGLIGVVIGGMIQVFFQRRRDAENQAQEIRQQVSSLATALMDYLTVTKQVAQEVSDLRINTKEARKNSDESNTEKLMASDLIRVLVDDMYKASENVNSESIALTTCKDSRIASQASLLQNFKVTAYNHLAEWLSRGITDKHDLEKLNKYRERIHVETEVLVNMVTPRRTEKLWRFRKRNRVLKRMNQRHEKTPEHLGELTL